MLRSRLVPRSVLAGLALAAALFMPAAGAQEPEQPRTVRIAISGYENNITPFNVSFGAFPVTHDLMHLVYDSLFWSQAKLEPEPWLAERATPNEDFTEWTVELRPGVRWHDGEPFTAEDVAFSFDYYERFPELSGRYAHHVFDVPPLEDAEVIDPQTVRLTFRQPAPQFPIMPGADLPIIPEHIWSEIEDPGTVDEELPIGTGPFKVTEIEPDQRYVMEANPQYFKGRPLVDRIEMPIVEDPSSAFQALRAGEIDQVARNLPPELVNQFADASGLEVLEGTRFESTQLYFNARRAPWSDPAVRKAISLAIDSQQLVDQVLLGQGREGNDGFIHPDSPWAGENNGHESDPQRAERMLEEAGYNAGSDGIRRDERGRPLSLEVLISSFDPLGLRAVEQVARQVRRIGVEVVPVALDPATLRDRRQAPEGEAPTYDAYLSTLETHAHADPDSLYYFFHSPGEKGFGAAITGWSNARFDELSERATAQPPQQRQALFDQMQSILAEEAPVVVLWYPDGNYAYRPAAYEGWISDPGHGIFTKRSFLPAYADTGAASTVEDVGESSVWPWVVVGLVALVVLGGIVAVRRRRTEDPEEDWGG
ncbi:MAG: ABC transporter substrate-binding protein [Solirubrobacteraceae bacterium MAG38_C4-C5]|nr:ABC transporter substrate-binding protein [Candidatus Siliceabacter maunaloa]